MPLSRRRFIASGLTALGSLSVPLLSWSNDFEQWRSENEQAFGEYQDGLKDAFQAYREAAQRAFNEFAGQVRTQWGDEETGSSTRWADYGENLEERVIVDFENGALRFEALVKDGDVDGAERRAKTKLDESAKATVEQAYQRDPVVQEIERELANQRDHLQDNGNGNSNPVIEDILVNQNDSEHATINEAIEATAAEAERSDKSRDNGIRIVSFSIPLSDAQTSQKAEQYRQLVNHYAAEQSVDPALVMAIMHSESSFNPMAKSHIPAFGLMQIVPESAGRDASAQIYGSQRLLSPSYLYDAENNVRAGCVYMNLLLYHYLSDIDSTESRVYCAIAAYNTGAGNVARAFTGNTSISSAARRINSMNPDAVYDRLVHNLPYEETRLYMEKVTPRYRAYQRS